MFLWETQTSLENPPKCMWHITISAPSKFSHSLKICKRKKILLEIPRFIKVSYYFPIFWLHVSLSKSIFFFQFRLVSPNFRTKLVTQPNSNSESSMQVWLLFYDDVKVGLSCRGL